jgi:hypothetical protein
MASCTDSDTQQAYSGLQYSFSKLFLFVLSPASVAGTAISYGLDCPGFESSQGHEIFSFSKPSRLLLGPSQLPIQWVTWFFPMCKFEHSAPSIAEVKNKCSYVPIPLYMPSWGGQGLYFVVFVFILRQVTVAAFILLTELRNKCNGERNFIRNHGQLLGFAILCCCNEWVATFRQYRCVL